MRPEIATDLPSLERYRGYLVLLARWHRNPRLQAKFDPSDLVQQTLVRAWQGLRDFRGETEAEFKAWLRRILTRCLADLVRDFDGGKRDAGRERSLDAMVTDSSARLEIRLDDRQSSPHEKAERNERLQQLADALETLPPAQQEAVTLFHLHGLSVAEIGRLMDRSEAATAGLLKRGLRALRTVLHTGETPCPRPNPIPRPTP